MPTIEVDTRIERSAADVWDAVRDVGALHTRLVPGFVVDTVMLPDEPVPVRRVTFATGTVLDEVIVTNDDARRRLVWSIRGVDHHNGAVRVEESDGAARVTWTADVLPATLADEFAPLMAAGLARIKEVLEGAHRGAAAPLIHLDEHTFPGEGRGPNPGAGLGSGFRRGGVGGQAGLS